MASKSPSPQGLKVTHHKPRLVVPAKSTPRELKHLSDIDDQEIFRHQIPVIMFYKNSSSMEGKDPATAIREALSKALVFYYPLAGRLVEGPNRKLMVDCTGEGVLFREADTDATLYQIGNEMLPGCPYLEELLRHVPGSDGILGCPLLLIQVTRFSCGGFSFALRLNHTMCDAAGTVQFLDAIAEFTRGIQNAPSVLPVWERELLAARQPPRVTFAHNEYNQMLDTDALSANEDDSSLIHKSFFFGPRAIRTLRNHLPPHHPTSYSTFDLVTACLLQSRTRALGLDPNAIVSISCAFNGRGKQHSLLVPQGYYGNVVASPASVSNAGMICTYPLEYSVELIKKAKAQMCEEYLRSVADFMVIKGRPSLNIMPQNCFVSDIRHAGFHKVDFGWGEPVYGGTARVVPSICLVTGYKNRRGENGIVLALCLPPLAMERFEQELKIMTEEEEEEEKENPYDLSSQGIVSKL